MNLGDYRERIVKRTGHYELVVDGPGADWTDQGMNALINDACRILDRMFSRTQNSRAWLFKRLAQGEASITFTQARIIREVWIEDGLTRTKLERKDLAWMRQEYEDVPLSEVTEGEPAYWVPGMFPLAPDHLNDATSDTKSELEGLGHVDTNFVIYTDPAFTRGLYVMPPCDGAYSVLVLADWQPIELVDDADINFWTSNPEVLDLAVRAQIELNLHRNRTGWEDFQQALVLEVQKLQRDYTAELVAIPAADATMNG
jgi:hypothetical protein